mgnify:CR=1 FL=1
MEKIELVCVNCKKINPGNGIWSNTIGQTSGVEKDSICPECCHQRFPHLYSDYEKPINNLKGASRLFSYFFRYFKRNKFLRINH